MPPPPHPCPLKNSPNTPLLCDAPGDLMVQRWSEMHATHQQSVRMLGTSNHSHKVRKPELLCKCPQHLILVIQRVCRSNRYERGGLSGLAMLSPCQFRAPTLPSCGLYCTIAKNGLHNNSNTKVEAGKTTALICQSCPQPHPSQH